MRKMLSVLVIGLMLVNTQVYAEDACKTVLCMGGMLTGDSGGSECSDAITAYFDIQVWKKGKFKASATKSKRQSFLDQCSAEDGGYKDKINSKWGGQLGF